MKLNAACLQLTSNDQPNENLDQVIKFSEQAVQSGANFVLTPENTFLFTMDKVFGLFRFHNRRTSIFNYEIYISIRYEKYFK